MYSYARRHGNSGKYSGGRSLSLRCPGKPEDFFRSQGRMPRSDPLCSIHRSHSLAEATSKTGFTLVAKVRN